MCRGRGIEALIFRVAEIDGIIFATTDGGLCGPRIAEEIEDGPDRAVVKESRRCPDPDQGARLVTARSLEIEVGLPLGRGRVVFGVELFTDCIGDRVEALPSSSLLAQTELRRIVGV
jgi:hypothetical protein